MNSSNPEDIKSERKDKVKISSLSLHSVNLLKQKPFTNYFELSAKILKNKFVQSLLTSSKKSFLKCFTREKLKRKLLLNFGKRGNLKSCSQFLTSSNFTCFDHSFWAIQTIQKVKFQSTLLKMRETLIRSCFLKKLQLLRKCCQSDKTFNRATSKKSLRNKSKLTYFSLKFETLNS